MAPLLFRKDQKIGIYICIIISLCVCFVKYCNTENHDWLIKILLTEIHFKSDTIYRSSYIKTKIYRVYTEKVSGFENWQVLFLDYISLIFL